MGVRMYMELAVHMYENCLYVFMFTHMYMLMCDFMRMRNACASEGTAAMSVRPGARC